MAHSVCSVHTLYAAFMKSNDSTGNLIKILKHLFISSFPFVSVKESFIAKERNKMHLNCPLVAVLFSFLLFISHLDLSTCQQQPPLQTEGNIVSLK